MDPVEFVRSTVRPMAEYTFPYVTSIVGILNAEEGEHVGSGLRCMLNGRPCLITANHVVEQANQAALGAGFVAERGSPPARLARIPDHTSAETDLAIYFLDDLPAVEGTRFWNEALIDGVPEQRRGDYLFLHGFPGVRSRFTFGGVHSLSLPYGVMERDNDLPEDMRPHEFAMDYDPNFMLSERGGSADFVAPSGLSGSPVWRIGASGKAPEAWTPDDSLLVGMVTRYNHEKRVLLATGIGSVAALIAPR